MYSIVDTHAHLLAQVNGRYWNWERPHPLAKDHRLDEYLADIEDARFSIDGLIWIEADTKYTLDEGIDGVWAPIAECKYVLRYSTGTLQGEGSTRPGFIKVLVPWAPIPWGDDLKAYVDILAKELGPQFQRVKAFRFLLQDKPPKTMTDPKFIEGLKWLDAHHYAFDWGIDVHNGGLWQFEESILVFQLVPNVRYIINHLTKPNLDLEASEIEQSEQFQQWKSYMEKIYATTPNSYMKLSGGFSELPKLKLGNLDATVESIYPWFKVAFDLWGTERTIWATNWPVCAMFSGESLALKWFTITECLFDKIELPETDRKKIYETNYLSAYNVRDE